MRRGVPTITGQLTVPGHRNRYVSGHRVPRAWRRVLLVLLTDEPDLTLTRVGRAAQVRNRATVLTALRAAETLQWVRTDMANVCGKLRVTYELTFTGSREARRLLGLSEDT